MNRIKTNADHRQAFLLRSSAAKDHYKQAPSKDDGGWAPHSSMSAKPGPSRVSLPDHRAFKLHRLFLFVSSNIPGNGVSGILIIHYCSEQKCFFPYPAGGGWLGISERRRGRQALARRTSACLQERGRKTRLTRAEVGRIPTAPPADPDWLASPFL